MTSQVAPRRLPTTSRADTLRFAAMAAAHVERIGRRIRERREELGLSQLDVARELSGKVDANQVSRWERGQHRPREDTLEDLSEVLGVEVAYFMSDAPTSSSGTPSIEEALPLDRLARIEAKLDALLARLPGLDLADLTEEITRDLEAQLGPPDGRGEAARAADPRPDAKPATRRSPARGTQRTAKRRAQS